MQLPEDPLWKSHAERLLEHRGPDGRGHFQDANCELVHRRLAIIDLTPTGDQPMPNEDGRVQVVFNGEIYNHVELRNDLQKLGHRFRGTSDTEVIAHLYEEEGQGLARRLRGMFAFAVYDQRRRCLLLGRDRFGIKPLYCARLSNQLVFASEIKAILAVSGCVKTIDRQACYDFLGLSYVPEPATGFLGIRMIPRGTTVLADEAGEHAEAIGGPRPVPRVALALDEAVEETETALLGAARRQSFADVPVAALLSGGIDSSLVVAAFCRATSTTPDTFNVRFPEAVYDETAMALAVAKHYGTRHHTVDVEPAALRPDAVIDLIRHFDQPFADSSLLPTYAVCRAIRTSGTICTVSGDGGDEAFGGYASFWRLNRLWNLGRLPRPARALVRWGGEALECVTEDLGRQVAKAARLAEIPWKDASRLFAAFYNYISEAQKETLVTAEARSGLLPVERNFQWGAPDEAPGLESLSRGLTDVVFADSLPSEMLRKVDMMSMRASIEVRVPLLDEEVVAIGLKLPHRLKTDGREGKLVLRALARRWLPEEVALHRKQGFSIPLDRMVDASFHQMLADLLLGDGARISRFLNMDLVSRWLRWFRAAGRGRRFGSISRGGLYQRVFILLALEIWLREQGLEW